LTLQEQYDLAQSAFGGHTSAISAHSSAISTRSKRHGKRGRMNYANLYARASESEEMHDITYGASNDSRNYFRSDDSRMTSGRGNDHHYEGSVTYSQAFNDVRPEDAPDAVSLQLIN
jgi:hypothetical protein